MNRSTYHEYLASREWALKREEIRKRSNSMCERCYYRNMSAVHHITYARVGKENLEDLMAICEPCHEYLSGKLKDDPGHIHLQDVSIYDKRMLLCPGGSTNIHILSAVDMLSPRGEVSINFWCEKCNKKIKLDMFDGYGSVPIQWHIIPYTIEEHKKKVSGELDEWTVRVVL